MPPAPTQSATHRFPRHRRSVARAREALRHQLAIWRLDATEPADSAVLLLSELTTNAVNAKTTTGREIAVRFELTGTVLRLEVSDASDEQPNMRHATADDESGRGLALVEALADEWGVKPRDTVGKIVWATLVLPEGGHVTTVTTATALGPDRCGVVRASLFYGAPIFSEVDACVRESGHPGDHRDACGGTWYLIPLVPVLPLPGDEKETE